MVDTVLLTQPFCSVRLRADAICPYSGVCKTGVRIVHCGTPVQLHAAQMNQHSVSSESSILESA